MDDPDFRYYLITDRLLCGPARLPARVDEACRNGIKAVQLREKDLPASELYALAREIYEITLRWGASLFINERADVALAAGAQGVHCREEGTGPADVKKLSRSMVVGASVHSVEAARRAQHDGADFIVFGPVYYTDSKAPWGEPQGTARLHQVTSAVDIPVFAVGGVTPANTKACLASGAWGIAGISAVMETDSVDKVVAEYRHLLGTL